MFIQINGEFDKTSAIRNSFFLHRRAIQRNTMRLSILAKLTILSIICTIGVTFLLLGCILPNSYWPLFILVFYVFLPIPIFIVNSCNQYGENTNAYELAIFLTAILLVSTFGLLIVIYQKDVIKGRDFAFAVTGNIIFVFTAIIYTILFHRKTDEF